MTVKHIKADAIEYTLAEEDRTLIHVCNNKGVMGSGIALSVRRDIPAAYKAYIRSDIFDMGSICGDPFYRCINMIAQDSYRGYQGNFESKRYLNYGALAECLDEISRNAWALDDAGKTEIVLPFKMGADRAGGDWEIVLEMVIYFLGDDFDITVCQLP